MEIHDIFPQPVYQSKLERELTKSELNAMDKFRPRGPLPKTLRYSTRQSKEHYVLETKELKNLKEDLNKMVVDYFEKVVCTSNSIFPHITQSWLNYTESQQFQLRIAIEALNDDMIPFQLTETNQLKIGFCKPSF